MTVGDLVMLLVLIIATLVVVIFSMDQRIEILQSDVKFYRRKYDEQFKISKKLMRKVRG